jgi:adenosylcobinamide kinase/adenosylcobinamide-phosphate guanylyltransferase
MTLDSVHFVLGGAASGKSDFAERLTRSRGGRWLYVATAEALDGEMTDKIAAHRARRGPGWRTVEAPLDPWRPLQDAGDEVVLLDCVTLWLSNMLLSGTDIESAQEQLLSAIGSCPAPLVVVSNEVGLGVVPETPLGRRFRTAQGALNRALAERAGLVVLVVAGLPLVIKGRMPAGLS